MRSKGSARWMMDLKRFRMINLKRFMANQKRLTKRQPAVIGLIVVCIVATAILIAARTPEPTAAAVPVKAQPTVASSVIPASASVETTVVDAKIAAKPQGAEAGQAAEAVTIEGCLAQDHDTFRLKNTSGEDAPKGRSWKSGFLHKGSKNVDVVDARHRLNLSRHVGERVSVSGMLEDKELQGTSLKRITGACN